jgi:apolipoprotein N-acyltransferase
LRCFSQLTTVEVLSDMATSDLVVWSETSVTNPMNEEDLSVLVPRRVVPSLGVPALFGAVIVKNVEDTRRYVFYNSALLTDRDGQVVGRFDKQRLVLFSESMPFGSALPILYEWSPNSGRFVPGTRYDPLRFGGHGLLEIRRDLVTQREESPGSAGFSADRAELPAVARQSHRFPTAAPV